jgi:hypothetical protein
LWEIGICRHPGAITASLLEFLLPPTEAVDSLQGGFEMRRAVLGDAHVDKAISATTDFTRVPRNDHSPFVGNDMEPFRVEPANETTLGAGYHCCTRTVGRVYTSQRAGRAHELEPCDLKEFLLQTAVYVRVPATNTRFNIASESLAKHD